MTRLTEVFALRESEPDDEDRQVLATIIEQFLRIQGGSRRAAQRSNQELRELVEAFYTITADMNNHDRFDLAEKIAKEELGIRLGLFTNCTIVRDFENLYALEEFARKWKLRYEEERFAYNNTKPHAAVYDPDPNRYIVAVVDDPGDDISISVWDKDEGDHVYEKVGGDELRHFSYDAAAGYLTRDR